MRLVLFCWWVCATYSASAEDWPQWRGPNGNAVSAETNLPAKWGPQDNVVWRTELPGEGVSSPIVRDNRVFLTSAFDEGARRSVICLDRDSGRILWQRETTDDNPEVASFLTGHAASTPACDGHQVVAAFGNAGVVCFTVEGQPLWHVDFGDFESELGFASSPLIADDRILLLCDHDGDRFHSFDSFLTALDLKTGKTIWKTERKGLYRSWSTPLLIRPEGGVNAKELIVNAQDHLRGYDPASGQELWRVGGMTGWVTPSPVYSGGLIFAASGRDGPTIAVRPGGRGDVTETHAAWVKHRGSPYVCSPIAYGDLLYVLNEQGILTCYRAATGELEYRERLDGKFSGSPVAGDDKLYFTNEVGATYVVRAGPAFELLARNELNEDCLASPAISAKSIFVRTGKALYRLAEQLGKN